MKHPFIFAKAASYLLIVSASIHIIGHFWLIKPDNETETALLRLMSSFQKNFAGGTMSPKDIQDGLNLCYALFFCYTGAINLFLLHYKKVQQGLIAAVSGVTSIAFFLGGIISLTYFFWFPVVLFFTTSGCFLLTSIQLQRAARDQKYPL